MLAANVKHVRIHACLEMYGVDKTQSPFSPILNVEHLQIFTPLRFSAALIHSNSSVNFTSYNHRISWFQRICGLFLLITPFHGFHLFIVLFHLSSVFLPLRPAQLHLSSFLKPPFKSCHYCCKIG